MPRLYFWNGSEAKCEAVGKLADIEQEIVSRHGGREVCNS